MILISTNKSQKGFTLIEAVVSASIFALAATSIAGVYIAVQRLNQRSASLQALQQNARYLSEDVTKIIRNGQVDYGRYLQQYGASGVPQPSAAHLYLIDQDNVQNDIYQSGDYMWLDKTGVGSTNFSGREVKVLNFKAKPHGVLSTQVGDLLNLLVKRVAHPGTKLT